MASRKEIIVVLECGSTQRGSLGTREDRYLLAEFNRQGQNRYTSEPGADMVHMIIDANRKERKSKQENARYRRASGKRSGPIWKSGRLS